MMPTSHPDAGVLLSTVVDFLAELAPQLAPAERYRSRVAANVLRTVQRELALREASDQAERAELHALLGPDADAQAAPDAALARAIRAGAWALDDPRLLAYLTRSLARALDVNNPGWRAPDSPAP